MLYPMHMMREGGFGDVLVAEEHYGSGIVFKQTSKAILPGCIANTTVKFKRGGTGFVIAKCQNVVAGALYVIGLILTAAHVVYDPKTLKPKRELFKCFNENRETCQAILIKQYSEIKIPLRSATSGNCYCFPGDVAILLLLARTQICVEMYPLATIINRNADCVISGYPQKPLRYDYCCPQKAGDPNLKAIVDTAFCNFSGLVYSPGKVTNLNNLLIDLSCSTTSGLSGSPAVCNGEVVGVYLGGPPLVGQREIFEIMEKFHQEQILEAWNQAQGLKWQESEYSGVRINTFIENVKAAVFYYLKRQDPLKDLSSEFTEDVFVRESHCNQQYYNNKFDQYKDEVIGLSYHSIYKLVTDFKRPELMTHNVAIAVTHPLFTYVQTILLKFASLQHYSSVEEAIHYLNT